MCDKGTPQTEEF